MKHLVLFIAIVLLGLIFSLAIETQFFIAAKQAFAIAQKVKSPHLESTALVSLANTQLALARRAKDLKDEQKAQHKAVETLAYYQEAAAIATSTLAKV